MGINNDLPGNKRDQDPDFTDCKSSDPTNSCEICTSKDPCFSYTDIVITEKGKEPVTITVCNWEYKEIYLIRKVADASTDDAPKFILFDEKNTFKFSAVTLDKEIGKIDITMDSKCTVDATICPTANFLELDKRNFNFFNNTHSQDLIFYDPNEGQGEGFIDLNFIEPVKQLLRGGAALLLPRFLSGSFSNIYFLEAAKQHKPDFPTEFSYNDGLYSRPDGVWSQAKISVLPYFGFKVNFGFYHTIFSSAEDFSWGNLSKNDQKAIAREINAHKNPDKPKGTHGGAKSRAQKGYKKIAPSLYNKKYDVAIGGSINLYGMEFEIDIEETFRKASETFELLTKNSFLGDIAKGILDRPSPHENTSKSDLVTFTLAPGIEVELDAKLESAPDLSDYGFSWDLSVAPALKGSMKVNLMEGIIMAASTLGGPYAPAIHSGLTFIRDKIHHDGGGSGLQFDAYLQVTVEYKAEIMLNKPYQDDFKWDFNGNEVVIIPELFLGVLGSIETYWASGAFVLSAKSWSRLKFKLAENQETNGMELLFHHDGIMIRIQSAAVWRLGEFTEEEKASLTFEKFEQLLKLEDDGNVGGGMEYIIQDAINENDPVILIS